MKFIKKELQQFIQLHVAVKRDLFECLDENGGILNWIGTSSAGFVILPLSKHAARMTAFLEEQFVNRGVSSSVWTTRNNYGCF